MPPARGFGLLGMRERVALLAGQLEIESEPGTGTRVTAELPVQRRSADPSREEPLLREWADY